MNKPDATPSWPNSMLRKVSLTLVLIIIAFLILNLVGTYVLSFGPPRWLQLLRIEHETIIVGAMYGQFTSLAMLSGLSGRTWIAGWLMGLALVLSSFGLTGVMVYLRESDVPGELFAIMSIMPAAFLGSCTALVAMRGLRGWRLTRNAEAELQHQDVRMEDIFAFSVVGACCLALLQLFAHSGPAQEVLPMILVATVMGWLIVLPAAYATFCSPTWKTRLGRWLGLILIATAVFLALNYWTNSNPYDGLWSLLVGIPAVAVTMMFCAWSILATGFRLRRLPKLSPDESTLGAVNDSSLETNPFENEDKHEVELVSVPVTLTSRARREARWLTIAVVALTIMLVAGKSILDYQKTVLFSKLVDPARYFSAAVQRVDIRKERLEGVVMSPTATDADLQQVIRRAPRLKSLSLAGMQVSQTTFELLKQLPYLVELDLSESSTKDAEVKLLPPGITKLSLAKTSATLETVLGRHPGILELDMSGTGIDDAALQALNVPPRYLQRLNLSNNPLSDAGLAVFLKSNVTAYQLNLSDTQVTGPGLLSSGSPRTIVLDGTPITDASLSALLKSTSPTWSCTELSIRRTAITGAMLPVLATRGISVAVGQGAITEADFEALSAAKFTKLGLNGPEFTGKCLTSGAVMADYIDLSNSSVSDDVLEEIALTGHHVVITLRNTSITEKGIENISLSVLDLRGTQVKPAALFQARTQAWMILMRHESFTPGEMIKLRNTSVQTDTEIPYSIW